MNKSKYKSRVSTAEMKKTKRTTFLRSKLVLTLVSLCSTIALLSVGVIASLNNFSVAMENTIDVEIQNVKGFLTCRREGGVVDQGGLNPGTQAVDFMETLFDYENGGTTAALETLQGAGINLSREYPSITYVFMYAAQEGTTKMHFANNTSGLDADKAQISFNYFYGDDEPADWSTANPLQATQDLFIMKDDVDHDVLYIFAQIEIDPAAKSFKIEDLSFSFSLTFENVQSA